MITAKSVVLRSSWEKQTRFPCSSLVGGRVPAMTVDREYTEGGSFREFRDGKSFRGVRCVITDTAEGSRGGENGAERERGMRRKNQLTLAQSENRRRV